MLDFMMSISRKRNDDCFSMRHELINHQEKHTHTHAHTHFHFLLVPMMWEF